jgi:hypothetical protein
MSDDRDDELRSLLRRGLGSLADESLAHRSDPEKLRTGAVAGARRVRRRRAVVAAASALVVAGVIAATAATGNLLGADNGTIPAGTGSLPSTSPSSTSSPAGPAPTVSTTATSTSRPAVGEQPLKVTLTVTSGPGSLNGRVFVARWSATWTGGDAPAELVLLSDETGLSRFSSKVSSNCAGARRSGEAHGVIDYTAPGPHALSFVVRVLRCSGSIERVAADVHWTWSPGATG